MYIYLHVKHALLLPDANGIVIFSTDLRKIHKYKFSRKFVWWEPSCSMCTDRRTEKERHDEANRRFSQFYERV